MRLFAPALAFVDLETTGTTAAEDAITEIGIVRVEADPGGRCAPVVTEWTTLVNPGAPIPPAIQALTGITDAMVRDAPPFAAVADEVAARHGQRLVRRPQRALRLRLSQACLRAPRAVFHRARAVHGQALAPAVPGSRPPQSRQRDRAARTGGVRPASRAGRCAGAVGVRAGALSRSRARGDRDSRQSAC